MKKLLFAFLILLFAAFSSAQIVVADKTGWSLVSYSNQQDNENAAANAIDGNYGTIWHTSWGNDAPSYPHNVVVDMGAVKTSIPAFLYLPRQDKDNSNGMIKGYEIYFKINETDDWGTPVTGEFANSKDLQIVDLVGKNITARYFKFVAISPITNGEKYASAAELGIAKTLDITKKYNLKLSGSDLYLQKNAIGNDGDFTLQPLVSSSDETFEYTFVPVFEKPCVYNIKISDNYFKVSGGWKCVWEGIDSGNPKNNQIILEQKGEAFVMRSLGRDDLKQNKCVGLDSKNQNSPIYADKDPVQWAYWEFVNGVALPLEIDSKYPAESANNVYYRDDIVLIFNRAITLADAAGITIKDAENRLVSNISVIASGAELKITHAPLALNTTYTVVIPSGAIEDYSGDIIWSFTTVDMTLPQEAVYNVVNTETGYYLTFPEIAPKEDSPLSVSSAILTGDDAHRQEFQLSRPDSKYPDMFNIRENFSNKYLYLSEAHWRMGLSESDQGDKAKFVFIPDGENYKIQILNNFGANNYFAPDNASDGVGCYLNKQDRIIWKLIKRDSVTSIDESASENEVSIYPTLTKGLITVSTPTNAIVRILDISGRQYASYYSIGQVDINMDCINGIYFVVIETDSERFIHKVILNR